MVVLAALLGGYVLQWYLAFRLLNVVQEFDRPVDDATLRFNAWLSLLPVALLSALLLYALDCPKKKRTAPFLRLLAGKRVL